MDQGQQFLSTPAPHRVVSPLYCLMLGFDHPPNLEKSEKEGELSQWAYHSCCDAADWHALWLPKISSHMYLELYIPTFLPFALMPLMRSVTNWQLLVASCPFHEQPELGLVSTSSHTIPYKLLDMLLIIQLTCELALFPRHGNMQMSVIRPAFFALVRPWTTFLSTPPQEQQPRIMAKLQPLLFMH